MNCYLLGVSHKNTPINIREKIVFLEYKKIQVLDKLSEMGLNAVVILSTCNRCEIYISTENLQKDKKILKNFFLNYFNVDNLENYIFEKTDTQAIEHIFKVAAGLDSMIIGEDQIIGQVKDAIENSMQLGSSSKYLNKLFREAITTAKLIKTKFKISQNPISISYIAVKMLCENMDIKDKKIMVIGTGKIGLLAINYLVENGAKNIICVNRSYDKIRKIIEKYPFISCIDYNERYNLLKDTDILISSTTSPHLIIKKEHMINISNKLYMLDLSLPRDIDENVGEMENISLYDIDSLSKISEKNIQKRKDLSNDAIAIIKEKIMEFEKWKDSLKVDDTIDKLSKKCEIIQKDTMDYINRKIELNHREKKIIEKMLASALKRLIKPSIKTLKQENDEYNRQDYIDKLSELFELNQEL